MAGNGQTDRKTNRQTGRQADRQTDRQTDRLPGLVYATLVNVMKTLKTKIYKS